MTRISQIQEKNLLEAWLKESFQTEANSDNKQRGINRKRQTAKSREVGGKI